MAADALMGYADLQIYARAQELATAARDFDSIIMAAMIKSWADKDSKISKAFPDIFERYKKTRG
jgi:Rod binding domain-containing protein